MCNLVKFSKLASGSAGTSAGHRLWGGKAICCSPSLWGQSLGATVSFAKSQHRCPLVHLRCDFSQDEGAAGMAAALEEAVTPLTQASGKGPAHCTPSAGSIRSVMQKYLEDRGEVTFEKIFSQKLGECSPWASPA